MPQIGRLTLGKVRLRENTSAVSCGVGDMQRPMRFPDLNRQDSKAQARLVDKERHEYYIIDVARPFEPLEEIILNS